MAVSFAPLPGGTVEAASIVADPLYSGMCRQKIGEAGEKRGVQGACYA